jgi:2-keto-4-pentenoate hydratase/2-oxohepta-3-ene-1,7-dioic acid hydratase in catechol pathway
MRVGRRGRERPAVQDDDDVVFDLSALTDDIDGAFLAADGLARVEEALSSRRLPVLSTDGIRVGPPVARPGAVLCIGQNYAAHAVESGASPPESPIVFLKHPNTVIGPYDDVRLPPGSERTDWEVELAVVIGRPARYLSSPDDALSHVAGYAVANDLSERGLQFERSGGQWSKGKCCETFNPLGPWLVPAAQVPDPQRLWLRSSVNGAARQQSTTADMIFGVAYLVWYLSQIMVLDAGDVINSGTPEGVGLSGRFPYLREGDVVEMAIEGLGRQRQRVVSADIDRRSEGAP